MTEIEEFFVSQGITAKHEVIIRASEPKPEEKRRATSDLIRIPGSIERIAKVLLDFLKPKTFKLRVRVKRSSDSIELIKSEGPERIVQFVQKHEGVLFEVDITL